MWGSDTPVDPPLRDPVELVKRNPDGRVVPAFWREFISPNFFPPAACAYLDPPLLGDLLLLFLALHLVQARTQDSHRLGAVLDLRFQEPRQEIGRAHV